MLLITLYSWYMFFIVLPCCENRGVRNNQPCSTPVHISNAICCSCIRPAPLLLLFLLYPLRPPGWKSTSRGGGVGSWRGGGGWYCFADQCSAKRTPPSPPHRPLSSPSNNPPPSPDSRHGLRFWVFTILAGLIRKSSWALGGGGGIFLCWEEGSELGSWINLTLRHADSLTDF